MKRSRWIRLLVLWVAVCPPLSAANVQELGDGLSYVRVKQLTAPLPEVLQAVVLDVRYVPDAADVSADLVRQLEQPGPIRIVLHDAAPPAALVRALRQRAPAVLTLGPSGAQPAPDFDLAVDAEADHAAYLAFEQGIALQDLTGASAQKDRFDEAALVRAQRGGENPPPPPPENEPSPTEQTEDRLLRRAIQLARGLLALQPPA